MSFANFKNPRLRHTVPPCNQSHGPPPRECTSDCWPDFSTELAEDEVETRQQENKPDVVLTEAAIAILYSVSLVILLTVVLQMLHKP